MNASHSAVSAQFVSQWQPVRAATAACLFNKSLDCNTAKILDRVLIRECDAMRSVVEPVNTTPQNVKQWSRINAFQGMQLYIIAVNSCTCGFHWDKCNAHFSHAKNIFDTNEKLERKKYHVSFKLFHLSIFVLIRMKSMTATFQMQAIRNNYFNKFA